MKALWERIEAGRHTAVVGAATVECPPGTLALRIACDRGGGPFAPLLEAWQRAQLLMGQACSLAPRDAMQAGLRNQLLGGAVRPGHAGASLVSVLNQLADAADEPTALILEAAEQADPSSLALLGHVLAQPGWLRMPVVLAIGATRPQGPIAEVVAALKKAEGKDAVVKVRATRGAKGAPELPELPWSCLQVLRAAALVGPAFEVDLVAHVLEVTPGAVLGELQRAADLGVAIQDYGGGQLRLPDAVAQQVFDGVLPSVASAWHRRAAERLAAHPPSPPAEPEAARPAAPARAAAHLERAGNYLDAAARHLDTAAQAGAVGAFAEALQYVEQGLALLSRLPMNARRHELQVRLLTERARVWWMAAGPGHEFTLQGALDAALEAESLLGDDSPAALKADVWTLVAQIQYDIGSDAALEAALDRLTRASRALQAAGDARAAARLLNDQAAVWVRIGDPIRAAELLDGSRQVFSRDARRDPVAALELADTEHLAARLPLHVPARPGYEEEAIERSIERATDAVSIYERIGDERGLARLWETIGRLHLLAHREDEARGWLSQAVASQQETGDVIGLARTAEALARLLAREGQWLDALTLIGDSLNLNLEKGSLRGIGYLERTIADLTANMPADARAQATPHLDALSEHITAARTRLT